MPTTSIPQGTTGSVTRSGVRHFRGTPSTFALALGPFKVCMAIRYLLADGEAGELTQAEIARLARVSQSTVNAAVNGWLDDDGKPLDDAPIIVERVARSDIRGLRWRFTPRVLPEVLANDGAWHGSATDQAPPAPPAPTSTPQNARADRSAADQHEDHDQYDQQQHDPAPKAPGLSANQALLYNALRAHPTIGHKTAMRLIARHPTRTPDEFAADLAAAQKRPNVPSPLGLVLHCWLAGEALYAPRMSPPAQELTDGTADASQPRPAAPARRRAAPDGGRRRAAELHPNERRARRAAELQAPPETGSIEKYPDLVFDDLPPVPRCRAGSGHGGGG